MPKDKIVHFNPPDNDSTTRCGVKLRSVKWTSDKEDVTCNRCGMLIRMDER